jgi:dihydroceramide fatty acyl 2-hydroxylase
MTDPAHPFTDEARAALDAPWREEGLPGRDDDARLFASRALDAIWRAPFWWPYAVALPAGLGLGVASVCAEGGSVLARLGWSALGLLVWTLFEHALHRFVFHAPLRSEAARAVLLIVHGHHHVWPRDRGRLTATPWQAGLTWLLAYGGFRAVLAPGDALAATAGLGLGYVAYEAMHFVAHHGRPRARWLRAIRAHHLRHHHEDPTSRWGISSPLWDVILGTRPRPRPGSSSMSRRVRREADDLPASSPARPPPPS